MPISITISVSEELEALFESMVMDVDSTRHVYQFIDHLVTSSHVYLRGEEHVELYLKDLSNHGTLKLLDTTLTLYDNHIQNKVFITSLLFSRLSLM